MNEKKEKKHTIPSNLYLTLPFSLGSYKGVFCLFPIKS